MLQRLQRLWRHAWYDESDVRKAVPADLLQRLTRRIGASEQRHSGEVRIHVEARLPLSYLWRNAPARERAIMMFSKLRVWDTARNNGVLIYLLLAEHAIEIVADRGVNQHVSPQEWQAIVQGMASAFTDSRIEDGLTQALSEVSAILVRHFPQGDHENHPNEQPDAPTLS